MTPPRSEPPLELGRYRVLRQLGEGGMGRVYEVEDLELGRSCALKVLQPELHANAEAVERFLREAACAAGLDHPNVVRVFDRGRLDDGSPYYTMEILRGHDLAELIARRRRLPWSRARHIAIQLCKVLERAHERGIIHRDLKPENCFLVELGGDPDFLKLLDFGIARQEKGPNARLTTTGFVLGTALYMSPQQARGEKADHRADVYAVGVLLYEMLAGRNPFDGENALQVLSAIQVEPVAPLTDFGVAPEVAALVARAMHRDLDARFPSAEALRRALEALEHVAEPTAAATNATKLYPVSPSPGPMVQATRLAIVNPAAAAPQEGAAQIPEPTASSLAKTLYSVPLPEGQDPRRRAALVIGVGVALVGALALALALAPAPDSPTDAPAPNVAAAAPPPLAPAAAPSAAPEEAASRSGGAENDALAGADDTSSSGSEAVDETNDDSDADADPEPADRAEASARPQRRQLTQAKVKGWERRQESKPPAACAELSRGYGTTFRFKVVTKAGKPSLKRMDSGNTGARCASQLAADFERWAARHEAPAGARLEASVRYGG